MGVWPGPDRAFLSALYGDMTQGKLGQLDTSSQAVIGYLRTMTKLTEFSYTIQF